MHKKITVLTSLTSLVAASLLLLCVGSASADTLELKFAGQNAANHPATKFMNDVAKEIAEKTEGRITVKVFPANQLGNYSAVYQEQIQGTIAMSCVSVPSDFDPRMELIYINGYVSDYEDAKRVFAQDGWLFKKMAEFNDQLGVKLLGFYMEGFIGTGSTKPAVEPLKPGVAKNVVVRTPNMTVYQLAAKAMGYSPVGIPYPDVYQAIQTGQVDGVNGYPVAAAYTSLGDVLKEWYMTNYSIEILNCMISKAIWAKIDPKDQKVIEEIFAKATTDSVANAKEVDAHYMDLMEKKGIKVHRYTKEELAPLMKACAAEWPKLEKTMGKKLIKEFQKELAPK